MSADAVHSRNTAFPKYHIFKEPHSLFILVPAHHILGTADYKRGKLRTAIFFAINLFWRPENTIPKFHQSSQSDQSMSVWRTNIHKLIFIYPY
jgi:hypothetical protein